jgi:hypothetical protein
MSVRQATLDWFTTFTQLAGYARCDARLLQIAADGATRQPRVSYSLDESIGFSFTATRSVSAVDAPLVLRYAIDVALLADDTVARMLQSGFGAIGQDTADGCLDGGDPLPASFSGSGTSRRRFDRALTAFGTDSP